MSAMAREIPTAEDVVLDGFLALETPTGFRAELIEGEIVVTPPPVGNHEHNISVAVKQILARSATAMDFSGHKGIIVPSRGVLPSNHLIPDVTFTLEESESFRDAESWMPSAGVAMVMEVTSSRPEIDRGKKRVAYARAGIPLYLLVDRALDTVTLFAEPEGDDYTVIHARVFGKEIDLPAPFSMTLDTTKFA